MAIPFIDQPPLLHVLGTAVLIEGQHQNRVWRAQAATPGQEAAVPIVVKSLDSQIKLSIELACGLAAQALQLPVPAPALVLASIDDLPGFPHGGSRTQLLIGSQYKQPDAFLEQLKKDDALAEEWLWSRVCDTSTGSRGAAWDELIANKDRHKDNLLFDGSDWWLFDHEMALPKATDFIRASLDAEIRNSVATLAAERNVLASQMVRRRGRDHALELQPMAFSRHKQSLMLQRKKVEEWEHEHGLIKGIFQTTGILLGIMELRLPALALLLQARIAKPPEDGLTWTST